MQINVEEFEYCRLKVVYQAENEEILNKKSEVIKAFKKAPVPGCRPGKASETSIRLYYAKQIDDALKRALAEDAYHNTIFEKSLRPHGYPDVKNLLLTNNRFTCEFEMAVKPNFELSKYTELEVLKPSQEMSVEEKAAKIMQEIRNKCADTLPYTDTDFVQQGDSVVIDYEGSIDGVKIDSLSFNGEVFVVGCSNFILFDDQLIGMKVGDIREFEVVAPESWLPSLVGKSIHFKVTLNMGTKINFKVALNMGTKYTPAALDDELAKKMGKNSYQELQEAVNNAAAVSINNKLRTDLNNLVSSKLINDNDFVIPDFLSLSEAKYLVHSAKLDWDKLENIDKEKYISIAKNNVKLALILEKIRESEPEAQLSDQEVFDIVKNNILKSRQADNIDEVISEMSRTGYLQILFARIKDEYTLDFINKSVKFIG
jgi:trigger factor